MTESDRLAQTVGSIRDFFDCGATLEPDFRKRALKRLLGNIETMEKDIEAALHEDLGKSSCETYMTETGMVKESIRYMLKHLRQLSRPGRARVSLAQMPGRARIYRQPRGTVLIISPWNYPLLLALDPLVAAIAAGNCCVLKPSEYAPATCKVLERLIADSFSDRHVGIITGDAAVGERLLDCRFDHIFYTGGKKVGRIVMEKASRNLTPVTLELGGKSPAVVLNDADILLAARRIAFGKSINCGQTCVAPDYVLVDKSRKELFIDALAAETARMYGDNPLESPDYGKIINVRHFARLERFISLALNEGQGRLVFGGRTDPASSRIAPAVIDMGDIGDMNACIGNEPEIMQEEIFGPILPVIGTGSADEAMKYIRSRERPLAAYLFTADRAMAKRFIATVPCGGGCINDTIMHLASPHLPFGGTGESGMGSYHGKWGFMTFTHDKGILHKSTLADPPIRYAPYKASTLKIIRRLIG